MSQTTEIPLGVLDSTAVSTTDYHQLLASKERRLIFSILADKSFPVELHTLAREVAEKMGTTGQNTSSTVDKLAVQLHHIHLPKMDELGAIEYRPAETTIKHIEYQQ